VFFSILLQLDGSRPTGAGFFGRTCFRNDSAPCHEIYPEPLTRAIHEALLQFNTTQMPGIICQDALLHCVETRTSSPVRVSRDPETVLAIGTTNVFPAGEGAGFAGGIVSAAVDGINVADAILEQWGMRMMIPESESSGSVQTPGDGGVESSNNKSIRGKAVGFSY
jgi:hypothetical protein